MSFKVLAVPEDPTYDRLILEPLVKRILRECGKPHANVTVQPNPRPTGYDQAKRLLIDEYFDLYSHIDLMLFLPDADGKDRKGEFHRLERLAAERGINLLCCAAEQEVEVWLLAGHRDKLSVGWQDVRADVSVKENVFEPFLKEHGNPKSPWGGRDLLMTKTLANYSGLLSLCPELKDLQEGILALLG